MNREQEMRFFFDTIKELSEEEIAEIFQQNLEEEDIEKLQKVITILQNQDEDLGHSIFDFMEEALKKDWEKHWSISNDGTMNLISIPNFSYPIDEERLKYPYLLSEILGKKWENTRESEITFYSAYLEALRRNGVKGVKIDLTSEEWILE